ncbi:MAG: 2-oxoacid:acceptor oxidoreductase subunit alpha [Bacteroidia bacterium]|nr:2-oxoacid:acceptor oxidoreductase subunit alpha [Bacteroidia bacterium]
MQTAEIKDVESVVIRFSGDSGDGMQLTGTQFTDTAAFLGKDLATFPEYPAEIRAPAGTVAGLSGFQVHFGSKEIFTPGDKYDVLVAMNAAALKVDLKNLKHGGIIIANTAGFDGKNLRLADYPDGAKPLDDSSLSNYIVYKMDVTKMTRDALEGSGLGNKEVERSKNMFVLGLLYWLFDKSMDYTTGFINEKFGKKPDIAAANIKAMTAGYNYGETAEIFTTRFKISQAVLPKGEYRNITGNQAAAIGFIAAREKSGIPVFLGSYPITPASDILHELSKYKHMGVKTYQAEDEIAAIASAIGASFGGSLGITTTSGPGVALKGEALGLATMLEIPLVLVDVQRGGPSTGLPTKTEQADLLIAMFGRHGEAPLPIIAANSPSDCFNAVFEACKMSIEHMTPVIVLTDGYIANGSEPWKFPKAGDLPEIKVSYLTQNNNPDGKILPYKRDERLVRPWIKPGTPGLMHRVGGLEKAKDTGNVSYDAKNHEYMIHIRQAKVDKIADFIPPVKVELGKENAKIGVLGWGSTFGAIKGAVKELIEEGHDVAHVHLRNMNPFPKNLGQVLSKFGKVIVPEMNNRQLVRLIRDQFMIPAESYTKIQGLPFTTDELKIKIIETLKK